MSTDVVEEISEKLSTGEDDNRLTHIVRNVDQMRAYVQGEVIVALCGKRWIPCRDPKLAPLCQYCSDRYEMLFGKKFVL